MCDIIEGIDGEDGIEITKDGTRWKIKQSKGESLGPSTVLPQPFDLDRSDPSQIAVTRAIITTGFMVSGDTFPVMRTSVFADPSPIACSSAPYGSFVLWYLVTQIESELIAQTSTNCMLSVDPDGDDPNHLLFRKPLYQLTITTTEGPEGTLYGYTVLADLRNSTLVRLS